MRKNDTGLTIFEQYDVVRLGKGKVEYTVLSDVVTHEAHIESKNTGKAQTVDASRLVLVRDIRTVPPISEELLTKCEDLIATASAVAEGTLSVPGLDVQGDAVPAAEEATEQEAVTVTWIDPEPGAESRYESILLPEENPIPEHTPGESPAAYQRRTGRKLDGRTTNYGRTILAGLQLKPVFAGRLPALDPKTQQAKQTRGWQRKAVKQGGDR